MWKRLVEVLVDSFCEYKEAPKRKRRFQMGKSLKNMTEPEVASPLFLKWHPVWYTQAGADDRRFRISSLFLQMSIPFNA